MAKRRSKSKKVMGWNEYQVLRAIVALAIVVYIVGIVPSYSKVVGDLFHEPVVKLIFLALIVAVGYMDSMLGVLLAVAFLVSMLSSAQYQATPLGQAVSGVQAGARQVVRLPEEVVQHVTHPSVSGAPAKESMSNPLGGAGYQTPNAQQAFEMNEQAGQALMGQGADCTVIPPPTGGCDPIVGYNAPYDCVCNENCADECDKDNRGCLCTGVATWNDELNAQGLNYPMGYAGSQEGATYN